MVVRAIAMVVRAIAMVVRAIAMVVRAIAIFCRQTLTIVDLESTNPVRLQLS